MSEIQTLWARSLTRDEKKWQLPTTDLTVALAGVVRERVTTSGAAADGGTIGPSKPWKLRRTGRWWAGLRVRNPSLGRAVATFRGSHGNLSNAELGRVLQGKARANILEPSQFEIDRAMEGFRGALEANWFTTAPEVVASHRARVAEAAAVRRQTKAATTSARFYDLVRRAQVPVDGGGA